MKEDIQKIKNRSQDIHRDMTLTYTAIKIVSGDDFLNLARRGPNKGRGV